MLRRTLCVVGLVIMFITPITVLLAISGGLVEDRIMQDSTHVSELWEFVFVFFLGLAFFCSGLNAKIKNPD